MMWYPVLGYLHSYLHQALSNWRKKRTQVLLSSLGVMAGVSGLVLVIALGEGAGRELKQALGTLGTGTVFVRESGDTDLLTTEREQVVADLLSDQLITTATLSRDKSRVTSRDSDQTNVSVLYATPRIKQLYKLNTYLGRFISEHDMRTRNPVCVLGADIGKSLYPRGQLLGQSLRVGQTWCSVVGLLHSTSASIPKLKSLNLSDLDQTVFVAAADRQRVDEMIVQFTDEQTMINSLSTLKRILELRQREESLSYLIPVELLRQKQNLQRLFQFLLLGAAAIMLIVGGIGIMNTMMINVMSRQSEIGLRRAIGAQRRDITIQFLTESMIIAVIGGSAGIVLGFLGSVSVDQLTSISMVFDSSAAIMGFIASVTVGVVFGSYPAIQAAGVSPVQALNEL